MKHSRPPDLKSSSNVSLPFAWITGPRKRTQLICSKCFQTFQFKEKLDHHFARKHESRNCENCPYCGKQCARLKVHIKICSAKPGQRPTKDFDKKETQSCICHFINATQNWLGRKRKLLSISISILFKMVANIRK